MTLPAPSSSTPFLIKGGRVIDPAHNRDEVLDVLVENGKVARLGKSLTPPPGAQIFDATGLIVAPGLVDIHVHLREPGNEGAETIEDRKSTRLNSSHRL